MATSHSKEIKQAVPASFITTGKISQRESRPSPPPDDVFTYRRLRRIIGILDISLPIVLVLVSVTVYTQPGIRPSISDYYYTHMREIFTGTLCGVGLFMICYKGHNNPVIW